ECIGQYPRLHWAVADDAGSVGFAPRELCGGDFALNHRERRLKGIDMPERLAAFQKLEVEVRHADRAELAFLDQPRHRLPGVFDWNASFVGPVELEQIDSLDAQTTQRF